MCEPRRLPWANPRCMGDLCCAICIVAGLWAGVVIAEEAPPAGQHEVIAVLKYRDRYLTKDKQCMIWADDGRGLPVGELNPFCYPPSSKEDGQAGARVARRWGWAVVKWEMSAQSIARHP